MREATPAPSERRPRRETLVPAIYNKRMARWVPTSAPPQGLTYVPDFLSPEAQARLLEDVRAIEYHVVRFRGVVANRRTAHFGYDYDYATARVKPTAPLPAFLERLRTQVAAAAGLPPERLAEALVSHYPPGAGIGWHRDARSFAEPIAGVSLGAPCKIKFRLEVHEQRLTFSHPLAPGSLYLLAGDVRNRWQHSISPMIAERYSITFRPLR